MNQPIGPPAPAHSVRRLSVVIPCFNEAGTLEAIVARVAAADRLGLDLEIIVIDDGSEDGSTTVAEALARKQADIRLVRHPVNRGKGAAIRSGFAAATGDVILVQDADLEYNPADYPKLLKPILDGRADVVFGSRFRSAEEMRVLYFWHYAANVGLTLLSNVMTNINLTDMETGYKVFRAEIARRLTIAENRFGFEPEITAKVSRLRPRPRIYEVGIGYSGRTYEEGKKIGLKDGIWAIWCIFRYNLFP